MLTDALNSSKQSVEEKTKDLTLVKLESDILLDTSKTAVVIISQNGTILQSNHHFEELFYTEYPDLKYIGDIAFKNNERNLKGIWLKDLIDSDDKTFLKIQANLSKQNYYFTVMLTPFYSEQG
ncbi:MAG: hypothetical protein RL154_642, partial [Pseudomonadota bacterium]